MKDSASVHASEFKLQVIIFVMYSVLCSVLAVIKFVNFCVVFWISGCSTRIQNVTRHSVELQNQFFFGLPSAFSEFKHAHSEGISDIHVRSHSTLDSCLWKSTTVK